MTTYYCPQTRSIVSLDPSQLIEDGGEGEIYAVSDTPPTAAKIFKTPSREDEAKVQTLLRQPMNGGPSVARKFAWPTAMLYADQSQRKFVGFLMPRVCNSKPLDDLFIPLSRKQKCPCFDYRYLLRTTSNLVHLIEHGHAEGYVIGDIRERNALVNDSAEVSLVDVDSWQVPDRLSGRIFPCRVGRPEYLPAELHGQSLAKVRRTEQHDRFALGVLSFRLLNEGTHPFEGVYTGPGNSPTIPERIFRGHFVYGKMNTYYRPKPLVLPFSSLHPSLRALFTRCFDEGYSNPNARPSAQEFRRGFQAAERNLIRCNVNNRHWYFNHLKICPWCERRDMMGGLDAFPSNPPQGKPKLFITGSNGAGYVQTHGGGQPALNTAGIPNGTPLQKVNPQAVGGSTPPVDMTGVAVVAAVILSILGMVLCRDWLHQVLR